MRKPAPSAPRHFNLAAISAYLAAGFAPAGASHWWAKSLG